MIEIRNIQEEDFQLVIDLVNKTQAISYKSISAPELIESKLTNYTLASLGERVIGADYFVAEDSGQIIGIIGLKNAEIRTFFVDPDRQGQGIGRQLYDIAEAKARELGIEKLSVTASRVGEPVYKHFGFVTIGEKKKERVGIQYSDAIMEKVL